MHLNAFGAVISTNEELVSCKRRCLMKVFQALSDFPAEFPLASLFKSLWFWEHYFFIPRPDFWNCLKTLPPPPPLSLGLFLSFSRKVAAWMQICSCSKLFVCTTINYLFVDQFLKIHAFAVGSHRPEVREPQTRGRGSWKVLKNWLMHRSSGSYKSRKMEECQTDGFLSTTTFYQQRREAPEPKDRASPPLAEWLESAETDEYSEKDFNHLTHSTCTWIFTSTCHAIGKYSHAGPDPATWIFHHVNFYILIYSSLLVYRVWIICILHRVCFRSWSRPCTSASWASSSPPTSSTWRRRTPWTAAAPSSSGTTPMLCGGEW